MKADPNQASASQVARERRLEMALELVASVLRGAQEDLDGMKRHHAPSKRGSNYTRFLESLERRLATAEQEARDVAMSPVELLPDGNAIVRRPDGTEELMPADEALAESQMHSHVEQRIQERMNLGHLYRIEQGDEGPEGCCSPRAAASVWRVVLDAVREAGWRIVR